MKDHEFICSLQDADIAKDFVVRLSQSFPGFKAKNRGRNVYILKAIAVDSIRSMVLHISIGFDWAFNKGTRT